MIPRAFPLVMLLLVGSTASAADWPQWLGPNRIGASPETGLLTTWPKEGPKVLWKVEGGDGYSSVAVANGKAFTMVQRGGKELAIALDAKTGKELWAVACAPEFLNDYGNGPRATPAVDGKHVYFQSVSGPFLCIDSDSGKIVWQANILIEFGAKNITWGLSASPLVDGDQVFVVPGAPGAGVVAYDKNFGKVNWKTGDDKAAYASPVAVTVGGQKQIIFFTAAGLLAVQPKDGKELWRVPWKTEYDCNICTPLVIGDRLFVSSGEKVGCALFQLKANGPPSIVWESKGVKSVMKNYWATSVAHDKHLYGLSGEFESVINLNCVELDTGKLVWSRERFGKGAITLADGHLFITTKPGDLVLVPATPNGYEEKARLPKFLAENRTVPTIADKKMYLRDRKNIMCLELAAK